MARHVEGWSARWLGEAVGRAPARWTIPLRPLAALFGAAVAARNRRYGQGEGVFVPAVPVISVGNLTVGGTNKTPTVDWLLGRMARPGRQVGVATRGYGRHGTPRTFRFSDLGGSGPGDGGGPGGVGDEPWLLARHHPDAWVAIDPDRVRGTASLAARGVTLVIADDAFQHRRLGRSFDLVLVDATCPWGNGRLLPAGILREPRSALGRADAVFLTRTDEAGAERVAALERELVRWLAADRIHRVRLVTAGWAARPVEGEDGTNPLAPVLPARRVFVMTGIARPESLAHTVRATGAEIDGTRVFRDHAAIEPRELAAVVAAARSAGADLIVCAEKDLPNLPLDAGGPPIWYPRVAVVVDRDAALLGRIERAVSGSRIGTARS